MGVSKPQEEVPAYEELYEQRPANPLTGVCALFPLQSPPAGRNNLHDLLSNLSNVPHHTCLRQPYSTPVLRMQKNLMQTWSAMLISMTGPKPSW